jgi:hypothetical protein
MLVARESDRVACGLTNVEVPTILGDVVCEDIIVEGDPVASLTVYGSAVDRTILSEGIGSEGEGFGARRRH